MPHRSVADGEQSKATVVGSGSGPLLIVVLTLFLCLAAVELGGRVVGYDFSGKIRAQEAYPIYYRKPATPLPPAFFRRSGPSSWTGKPLQTATRLAGAREELYVDEKEITVDYDRNGFRNPPDQNDWEIVIVGDSFVELGYLAYEDLFTSRVGALLGRRVHNLGLSYSGPLTYTTCFDRFGRAPSLKHAILVFFEGNDVTDLIREANSAFAFKTTGRRASREISAQTSFVRWIWRLVTHGIGERTEKTWLHNALFLHEGTETPVSVVSKPPYVRQLHHEQQTLIRDTLQYFSKSVQQAGGTPWIVYMPCKRRVLHGKLRFLDNVKPVVEAWIPSDLSTLIEDIATESGAGFVDFTDSFHAEVDSGRLVHNAVWDTHLNSYGSAIAAETIAAAIEKFEANR